jgi:hypothetical protein
MRKVCSDLVQELAPSGEYQLSPGKGNALTAMGCLGVDPQSNDEFVHFVMAITAVGALVP